jgi:hypothetical protein
MALEIESRGSLGEAVVDCLLDVGGMKDEGEGMKEGLSV